MILLGLSMLAAGLGTLFAMVIQVLPADLWLSLAAYGASFTGVFLAGFTIAARRIR